MGLSFTDTAVRFEKREGRAAQEEGAQGRQGNRGRARAGDRAGAAVALHRQAPHPNAAKCVILRHCGAPFGRARRSCPPSRISVFVKCRSGIARHHGRQRLKPAFMELNRLTDLSFMKEFESGY